MSPADEDWRTSMTMALALWAWGYDPGMPSAPEDVDATGDARAPAAATTAGVAGPGRDEFHTTAPPKGRDGTPDAGSA